ncbi:MAG: 4-hydroxybenzoate 3-monooxygenase [Pseudomonadota bacterium]
MNKIHRTSVAIIGGGPSGMLLAQILANAGIDSIVIERTSRERVLARIRAGVLEWGSVETLRAAGVGERMDREGHVHSAVGMAWDNSAHLIDIEHTSGRSMMAFGQTALTEELYKAHDAGDRQVHHDVEDVTLDDVTGSPRVHFVSPDGSAHTIECDIIAGCDGYHGVSRQAIPADKRQEFEKVYPFGWLGIMSETPPLPELWYGTGERGFCLASQRNPMLSRYYVQCPLTDTVEDWSDDRFWSELTARLPEHLAADVVTGPSIEKSIAPLRSFVCEPMQWGKLFLVGDAAHIVPPTGAKGLNLAISDVHYLSSGLIAHYKSGDSERLNTYSETALRRVWATTKFSWQMTNLLHRFPDNDAIDIRLKRAEYDFLTQNTTAQAALGIQYAGVPYEY